MKETVTDHYIAAFNRILLMPAEATGLMQGRGAENIGYEIGQ